MAINVNVANAQAGQLSSYANQLRNAKNQLTNYKSSLSNNWKSQEVTYITRAIDQVIAQIDSAIKQLNSISTDVKSTAATIKREDDAAAAAARAARAKQQRIQTAQTNYNRAVNECDDLYKQRDELQKTLSKNMSASKRAKYMKQWDELMKKIQDAEKKRTNCYNSLVAARR